MTGQENDQEGREAFEVFASDEVGLLPVALPSQHFASMDASVCPSESEVSPRSPHHRNGTDEDQGWLLVD